MPLIMPLLALAVVNPAVWRLSAEGLGPIRIGMTESAVVHIVGSVEDDRVSTGDYQTCHEGTPKALPNVSFMFERGLLSRIAVKGRRDLRTPDGIGIGSPERRLRQLYGRRITLAAANYDVPGHSLLVWEKPGKRGVRFLTDANARVSLIYAGASSIEYIEGCL